MTPSGQRQSIATKQGDGGRTSLLYGGRVRKDSARIECNGAVDEAQSALGMARAQVVATGAGGPSGYSTDELGTLLVSIERDLWVLMAEVATAAENRHKLVEGASKVSASMVERLEEEIDRLSAATEMPHEFVVPGEDRLSAALDLARTVVRRAERVAVAYRVEGSQVGPYLNRLSDLVWALARFVEGPDHRTARGRD